MSRFVQFASLLLIALWLPATSHCKLEGLGLSSLFACPDQTTDTEHGNDSACSGDSCQAVESGQFGLFKSRIAPAMLPSAVTVWTYCVLCVARRALAPRQIFVSQDTEPLQLQRTWQFTRRAALPARAPDILNA